MAHLFTFSSGRFLQADERPNPINPIAGEGALRWLCAQLVTAGFECGTPDAEDWGWYTHVISGPRTYLLGVSGEWPESGTRTDWTVQLEPSRSMWEKLSGANKLAPEDAVSTAIESAVKSDAEFTAVSVERGS
jgi:hypothetical protein